MSRGRRVEGDCLRECTLIMWDLSDNTFGNRDGRDITSVKPISPKVQFLTRA